MSARNDFFAPSSSWERAAINLFAVVKFLIQKIATLTEKGEFTGRKEARPGPDLAMSSFRLRLNFFQYPWHLIWEKCSSSVTWIKRSWRRGLRRHTQEKGGWKEGKERRWQSVYVFEVIDFFFLFWFNFHFSAAFKNPQIIPVVMIYTHSDDNLNETIRAQE